MSTRSVIAVPDGDSWQGRFCHWNGYPTWNGRVLWAIVQRDGREAAQRQLVRNTTGCWSSIDQERPDLTGVRANSKAEFGSLPYIKASFKYEGKNARNVPGLGIRVVEKGTDWWLSPDTDLGGIEWVYVLTEGGLLVLRGASHSVGLYRWDEAEPDWGIVECGANYEWCGHVASHHFPECTSRLDTATWLGRTPLTLRDAIGWIDADGVRWEDTGSGGLEFLGRWSGDPRSERGKRWFQGGKNAAGERRDFYVWDSGYVNPNPALKFLYPEVATQHIVL